MRNSFAALPMAFQQNCSAMHFSEPQYLRWGRTDGQNVSAHHSRVDHDVAVAHLLPAAQHRQRHLRLPPGRREKGEAARAALLGKGAGLRGKARKAAGQRPGAGGTARRTQALTSRRHWIALGTWGGGAGSGAGWRSCRARRRPLGRAPWWAPCCGSGSARGGRARGSANGVRLPGNARRVRGSAAAGGAGRHGMARAGRIVKDRPWVGTHVRPDQGA